MARLSGALEVQARQLYFGNDPRSLHAYSDNASHFERTHCERVALPLNVCNGLQVAPNSLPVRGRAAGTIEGVASKRWRQLERFAQSLRSLAVKP